ncbi:MAG: RNA pyrophosphohydrolase [Betaproteobacteria bacterium AqS2]|uniref:RNA pyrophosphohydrolase n=1 Tax=Candidatus Amphirhobacter heronislandensis TaxID=1732024 RepID=A0A930UGH3_9GAMM|nr:RNA pyrophosphohydrolase [Betaproteobacteria bacterium AqS2]
MSAGPVLDPDLPLAASPRARYRPCCAVVVCRADGHTLSARRAGTRSRAWQYPQGGIQPGETPRAACLRELREETGLSPRQVEAVAHAPRWLAYDIPAALRGATADADKRGNKGQIQAWFLLRLTDPGVDLAALLARAPDREFEELRWRRPADALARIVEFKRPVYAAALAAFAAGPMAASPCWRRLASGPA